MKIKTKDLFGEGFEISSIEQYISACMTCYLSEGQVESISSKTSNNSKALGKLVSLLVNKGLLDINDIVDIGGNYEPHAEFVEEHQ